MPPPAAPLPVAVIGGGLTGLTAAWNLRCSGVPVVVFEAAASPGGVIASTRDGDWLWETGPNTLLEGSADITAFVDAVGLGARRQYAADEAKKDTKLRAVVLTGRTFTGREAADLGIASRALPAEEVLPGFFQKIGKAEGFVAKVSDTER